MQLASKKIFILSVLIIFLLGQNLARAEKYNVYTPTTYKQIQIVQSPKRSNIEGEAIELLVDYSGSMLKWISIAKDTLIYILPKIPETSAVALRVLGDVTDYNNYSYFDSCKATRLVSYFKKGNQSNIIKGLQEAKAGGNTPLEFALKETINKDFRNIKIINNTPNTKVPNKKIILITDGGENCGGNPCEYIKQVMAVRNDITIDVIQLGYDNSLMCLTNETGGKFYKAEGNPKKFETALEETFNLPQGTVEQGKYNKQPINNNNQKNTKGYKFIKF